jgi:F-type H+-transporting ATPase subunit a|tara:strand:- start:2431 stop:3366 length:936 start_codon:yes stop_codon:yes gene_type:complete
MLIDKTDKDPVDIAIEHVANSDIHHPLFDIPFLKQFFFGIDLSITKHVFLLFLVAFITVSSIVFLVQRYISSKTKIPGKMMSFIEMVIVFLRKDILKGFIGEKYYKDWEGLVYSLFFFILIGNFLGLIPIFDLLGLINYLGGGNSNDGTILANLTHGGNTVTANINVNFALALITCCAFTVAGIRKYGFFEHWKNLAPPGLALPLYLIVIPIEIMAMLIRPLSLTLRLAGNMMGGHLALIIFTMFIITNANVYGNEYSYGYGILAGLGTSIFSVTLSIGIILLEILIAFIQAYVFALLTAVYIGMAVNVDH